MRTLSGRVAVITGAARGIGRAIAEALSEAGCRLALADLDERALEETRAALGRGGRAVSAHVVDVADPAAIEALHGAVLATHGAAHVLVNNAGITMYGLFEEMRREELERVLAVNLWGVVDGCRVFLPTLRAQPEAHIVNVASMAALTGFPFQTAYCASKSAVRGLTEALRAELAGSSVGITCVMPGAVRTSLLETAESRDPRVSRKLAELMSRYGYPPERVARQVVRAIREDRARLVLTPEGVAVDALLRIAPGAVRASMSGLFRVASRLGATRREGSA